MVTLFELFPICLQSGRKN